MNTQEQVKWADVAHLYLGCTLSCDNPGEEPTIGKMVAITPQRHNVDYEAGVVSIPRSMCTPYLRTLDSLTEEEGKELFRLHKGHFDLAGNWRSYGWWAKHVSHYHDPLTPKAMAFLLSIHVDLFGLIKSGQALNAADLEKGVGRG